MLCSVVYIAVFAYIGVIRVAILLPSSQVDAALPPGAEDEVVLIEHLPGRRVHLQDFFWTGSEDAPPWIDPEQTLTLYETRTVHHTATVYLPDEGKPGSDDPSRPGQSPECVSCIEPTPTLSDGDEGVGVLTGDDPGPRYWLLTVLREGGTVPPKVELRLARLYRAAFSRQQERHLGLLAKDIRYRRATKRRAAQDSRLPGVRETVTTSEAPANASSNAALLAEPSVKIARMREVKIPMDEPPVTSIEVDRGEISSRVDSSLFGIVTKNASSTRKPSDDADDQAASTTPNASVAMSKNDGEIASSPLRSLFSAAKRVPQRRDTFNATKAKLRILDVGKVEVRMQNTSVIEGGATRLIYSVHLGGKPVPAATAARDMALLSPQEVALELGSPVIIQSEPYLKETRPLALSRSRDAWLLIGAAGAGLILLVLVLAVLVFAAKKKRAHSAVSIPPSLPPQGILKKDREYSSVTPGLDNTGYTSETEARTDGTSQRPTPGSRSRTPATAGTPDSVIAEVHEVSSDNEDDGGKARTSTPWQIEVSPDIVKKTRSGRRRVTRTNAIDPPRTPDSMDTVLGTLETLDQLENGLLDHEVATTSPHSYLSMPSCKQFPRMRSVEPLSRVLEPVAVRRVDLELDSPEAPRKNSDANAKEDNDRFLVRTTSALRDPGVVGPIVWDLRRQKAIEDTTSETDMEPPTIPGPVGRARRRLHELLEDSFSLFGSREPKSKLKEPFSARPPSAARSPDRLTIFSETRGRSANVSPVGTPASELKVRPRTSLPKRGFEEAIPETGNTGPHPRGAWGSRPLSAGPFHRPTLPEVDTVRVLADPQLPPEDPAVPLIAAIKKELQKFSP